MYKYLLSIISSILFLTNCAHYVKYNENPLRCMDGIVNVQFDLNDTIEYESLYCILRIHEAAYDSFNVRHDYEWKYKLTQNFVIYDTLLATGMISIDGMEHAKMALYINIPLSVIVKNNGALIFENEYVTKFIAGVFDRKLAKIPYNDLGVIDLRK